MGEQMVNLEIRSRAKMWCIERSLKTSIQQLAFSTQPKYGPATLCRPNSKNGKRRLKLGPVGAAEKREKGLRQLCRKDCRIGVGPLLSIKVLGGWGLWLRDTGRGLQNRRNRTSSPTSREIGKAKAHRGGAETRRTAKIGHRQRCLGQEIADIARDRKTPSQRGRLCHMSVASP